MSLKKLILSLVLLPCVSQANSWADAWQTKDQQGASEFEAGDYKASAQAFQNSDWKGAAYYKAKDYDKAYDEFKKDSSATGLYNQGNALTQLGKYSDAIDAYNKAIEKRQGFEDAKSNLKIAEELDKQQKDQKDQKDQNPKEQNAREAKVREDEMNKKEANKLLAMIDDDPGGLLKHKFERDYQRMKYSNG